MRRSGLVDLTAHEATRATFNVGERDTKDTNSSKKLVDP